VAHGGWFGAPLWVLDAGLSKCALSWVEIVNIKARQGPVDARDSPERAAVLFHVCATLSGSVALESRMPQPRSPSQMNGRNQTSETEIERTQDESTELDGIDVLMEQLAGSAVPDPEVVAQAWQRASPRVQEQVMTDSTMGPKARTLGLAAPGASEEQSGWQSWLPQMQLPSGSLPSLPEWASSDSSESASQTSESASQGWSEYLSGVDRGFRGGFSAQTASRMLQRTTRTVRMSNRRSQNPNHPLGPSTQTWSARCWILATTAKRTANSPETPPTEGGGNVGDSTSDGEGRTRVAAGTRDPVHPIVVNVDGEDRTTWVGASDVNYGVGVLFDYTEHASPSYSCVGAVSVALEAGGLYEAGDTDLDGRQQVTHGKRGDRSEVRTGGGSTDRVTMESLVNIAEYESGGEVRSAISRDSRILEEAKEQAMEDADLAELPDKDRADAVLCAAYDVLMSSDQRDERLAGAGAALQHSGLGKEINPADAKPGDTRQHWDRRGGGHSTIVHVVEGYGTAKVDKDGFVRANGEWRDGPFSLDPDSQPELVGPHRVVHVRLSGAHSRGGPDYNRGEEDDGGHGIFTNEGHKAGEKTLEFYGRPNNSDWFGWTPTVNTVDAVLLDKPTPELQAEPQDSEQQGWSEWAGRKARQLGDASGLVSPTDKANNE
jgi:hypothetical protein